MKKILGITTDILVYLLFSISVLLAFSAFWMLKTWPNLEMEELVFQLSRGFGGTGNDMISSYMKTAGIPSFLIILLMGALLLRLRNRRWFQRISLIVSAVLCLAISGTTVYESVGLKDYVVSQTTESEFIKDNYANPKETAIVFPEQKRNLIYIFLESMETTFADEASGGAFEKNTIPELSELAKANESFSGDSKVLNGAYSLPGTTWTMGGMFAATAGLPLQVSINGNDMSSQEEFFPGITAIGDVLEDNGYQNVLLIGSDAVFGGRELYFKSHGNYQIRDYKYANEHGLIPKDYYVWWGYEDNKLINIAKSTLDELSSKEEPFNLTMLTVDTHFEDGWLCDDCPDTFGDDRYANVMACSSKQISEFVKWCETQPWYADTAIVLSGDHPTMDVDFTQNVTGYERRVYTAYINSAVPNATPDTKRLYSTFDNFPTTLAAMGVYIEGDRLGLGTNLFSGRETLTEVYGKHDETALLKQKSNFMSAMSGVSVSAKDLYAKGNTLVNADIRITGYDETNGILSISADDILIGNGAIHHVRMTVENEQGTVYYEAKANPDGSYSADVHIPKELLSSTSLRISATYEEDGQLHGGTVFGCSEGNLLYIGSLQQNPTGYINYLNTLDPEKYSVFITAQGDVWHGISDEIQQALYNFGCETDLKNQTDLSWFAIKDKGEVLERSGSLYLEWYGSMSNWNTVIMASASQAYGNTSSIMINDRVYGFWEYCPGNDGFNIVVWNNETNEEETHASFNTTKALPDCEVSFGDSRMNQRDISITVSSISNFRDAEHVYGIIYDENNPGKKVPFDLQKQEDGSFKGEIETYGIDLNMMHIKLMASDLSEQPVMLKELSGSLTDYMSTAAAGS